MVSNVTVWVTGAGVSSFFQWAVSVMSPVTGWPKSYGWPPRNHWTNVYPSLTGVPGNMACSPSSTVCAG